MSVRVFDAAATEALLPYGRLADEIGVVLGEFTAGQLRIAERTVLPLERGTLLCMPASDDKLTITKVVTVHPGNAAVGKPTISAEMIVADAATGERIALLEGAAVTRRRTAALSLLALKRLLGQRTVEGPVLVFGAGDQARGHCEALSSDPRTARTEFVIAARSATRAEGLVADLRSLGVNARMTDHPESVLPSAAVVVTATTSLTPVLTSKPRDGAVVCAVGAFRHDMAEVAPDVVAGAELVVVDTLHGAKAEAGDLIQAAAAGAWNWEGAVPLFDLLAANPARAADQQGGYSIFKSVGHAMYDLAAARVAFGAR